MPDYKELYRLEDPAFNDAFDRTVVNIHLRKHETGARVFLICGCSPQTGATTIAINLAISMANSGWKVLLIDADMRKEAKYKRLSHESDKNLAGYLLGNDTQSEILCGTNHQNLTYIAGGKPDVNPIQLLCSARMSDLLEEQKPLYDYIIIDVAAPCAAVDANILGALADEAVLVAAWNRTTTSEIESTLEELSPCKVSIMGVIVNRMNEWDYSHNKRDYQYFIGKKYTSGGTTAPAKRSPFRLPFIGKKKPPGGNGTALLTLLVCLLFTALFSLPVWAAIDSEENPVSGSYDPSLEAEENATYVAPFGETYSTVVYKPEVILTSYSITQGSLVAGNKITVEFTLMNTSRTKGIFDLILSFETSENQIYAAYGDSSSAFITAIAPGATYRVEKQFMLAKSAPEIVELPITLRYQGVNSGTGNSETAVYFPVFGANSFTSQLDVGTTTYAGTPMIISGYCTNTGGRDILNLAMRLEGGVLESPRSVELGNLADGGQISVQEIVEFPEPGTGRLSISFYFEDEEGNSFALNPQEYTVTVLEMHSGQDDAEAAQAPRSFPAELLAVIIVAVAIAVIFYVHKRQKS